MGQGGNKDKHLEFKIGFLYRYILFVNIKGIRKMEKSVLGEIKKIRVVGGT